MTPVDLDLSKRLNDGLFERVAFAHGHKNDYLDVPCLVNRPGFSARLVPTVHGSWYWYECRGRRLLVWRGFLWHMGDYGIGGHKGDSESFVVLYADADDPEPLWALTRQHYYFHVYRHPELIDGRLWLRVRAGKHPITVAKSKKSRDPFILYGVHHDMQILDMEGASWFKYELTYREIFRE